jgi:hypothetical protein
MFVIIGGIALSMLCCVHHNIFFKKRQVITNFIKVFLSGCAFLVGAIAVIELLKLCIYGIGMLRMDPQMSNALLYAGLSYAAATIGSAVATAIALYSSVKRFLPIKVILLAVGAITPLIYIGIMAGMCVWYIYDHTIEAETYSSLRLQVVELVAWLYFFIELCFCHLLNSSINDMYRYRLKKMFYKDGQDIELNHLPKRPVLLCNATLNNYVSRKDDRTFHPFTFSQSFIGSNITGFRTSEEMGKQRFTTNVYTSFAMAVSSAAIAINSGAHDLLYSSVPLRATLLLLSINLGVYTRFLEWTKKHTIMLVLIVADNVTLFSCIIAKFMYDWIYADIAGGFRISLWIVQCLVLANMIVLSASILIPVTLSVFDFKLPAWFPINMPVNDLALFRSLPQVLGLTETEGSRYIFLSGGDHFDNLGIYELLRRKCKTILAFDGDVAVHSLKRLQHTLLAARKDGLIRRITFLGGDLDTQKNNNCVPFDVEYNDGSVGRVWFGRAMVNGDEKGILKLHVVADEEVLHVSNKALFLTEYQLDANRRMGKHVGLTVVKRYKNNDLSEREITVEQKLFETELDDM